MVAILSRPHCVKASELIYGDHQLAILCLSLLWRHNECDGVSNHQPHDCLLYSGVDQRKHQSSASLAFVWGIHRGQVNSPHKWPVTRKMIPFDDVIMFSRNHVDTGDLGPVIPKPEHIV